MSSSLEDLLNLPDPPGGATGNPGANAPLEGAPSTTLPEGAPPAPTRAEYDDIKSRLERQERENQELRSRLPEGREHAVFPTTMPQGITSPQQAKEELERQYIADPVGFLLQFGNAMIAASEQRANARFAALGDTTTGTAVDAFRKEMQADPSYTIVGPEFDKLFEQNKANINPANLRAQLQALYAQAYGQTLLARPADGRQNTPPLYAGTGRASGSADSGGASGNGAGQKLTAEEQIYYDTMTESGFKPEEVVKMMKERRANA